MFFKPGDSVSESLLNQKFPVFKPDPSLEFPKPINGSPTHIHLKARNLKEAIRFKISKSTSIPLSLSPSLGPADSMSAGQLLYTALVKALYSKDYFSSFLIGLLPPVLLHPLPFFKTRLLCYSSSQIKIFHV